MSNRRRLSLGLLVCLQAVSLTWSFPDGPFPKLTGGFSEDTCVSCHNSYLLNEGRTVGGDLAILGVPRTYEEGNVYPIRVVIGQPGQSRWGFELAVRHMASGHQAGQLRGLNDNTQIRRSSGVQYLMHTEAGSRAAQSDGPVEFEFEWVAPDPTEGPVLFNASGNASNHDGKITGDYIYTAGAYTVPAHPMAPLAVEVQPPSTPETSPARITDDSRVVHLFSPRDLDQGSFEVLIQHRFLGNVSDIGDAFGIDRGANINLEATYGLTDRLSVSASRSRFNRIVEFAGIVDVAEAGPFRLAVRGGVDGQQNFKERYSPFVEVVTQFDYKFARAYVVPVFVFNTRPDPVQPFLRDRLVHPEDDHTISLGLGADFRLTSKLSVVGEYVPRLYGFGGLDNDRAAVSGGVKIRTWGHVFSLVVSNSRVLNPSTYGVNATSTDYGFGFNIYRKVGR